MLKARILLLFLRSLFKEFHIFGPFTLIHIDFNVVRCMVGNYHNEQLLRQANSSRRTRGHEVTLVKDQCRLDIRKYSLSQRTINEWNNLSTNCKTVSSVNMLKNMVASLLTGRRITRK